MSKYSDFSSRTTGASSNVRRVLDAETSIKSLREAKLVPPRLLMPNPKQVRRNFDETALQELAEDIKERGILQPLIVRENEDDTYEIVCGTRRFLAARIAGLTEVPVIIRNLSDKEAKFVNLAENLQREQLTDEEERDYFLMLQAEFNFSITDIAAQIKKSRDYVRRRLEGVSQPLPPPIPLPVGNKSDSDDFHNLANFDELHISSQSARSPKAAKALITAKTFVKLNSQFDKMLEELEESPPSQEERMKVISELKQLKAQLELLEENLIEGGSIVL